MMSRVLFSTILERPSFLEDAPASWKAMFQRLQNVHREEGRLPHLIALEACAGELAIDCTPSRRKGLYTADLLVDVPQGNPLALHLMSEAEFCPLTEEILGPTQLKQRHMKMMSWRHIGLNRKAWMALDHGARVDALQELLSRYTITRRKLPDGVSQGILDSSVAQDSTDSQDSHSG